MSKNPLITDADRIRLFANALNAERDHFPVLKLSLVGTDATWLITEVDLDEEPDRLFGLCDLGLGSPEMGFVSLDEIIAVGNRLGLPVERDLHFVADKPLSAYAEEARIKGRITTYQGSQADVQAKGAICWFSYRDELAVAAEVIRLPRRLEHGQAGQQRLSQHHRRSAPEN